MEEGVLPNEVGLLLEGETALCLHLFQRGQIREAHISQRLVGERPEVLSRLELGGVGGQDEQMDALGDLDVLTGMPSRSIQDQRNPLGRSCTDIPSKGSQHLPKERRLDGGQEPPLGLAGGGTDEATEIEPLVALLDGSNRPLADRCPHPADQRQEANPVLIGRPELDRGIGMRRANRSYLLRELS